MARPAVIVPTHSRPAELAVLLDSLRGQSLPHEVVVVDNGSTDGTSAMLANRFSDVRVVRLPENVGFGRAVNRGVAESDADTVVFVNDDAVCEPGFVGELVDALAVDRGVTMAAGVLLDWATGTRIDTAGIVFDTTLFAVDYLHGEPASVLDREVPDPFGPSGGAAAFNRVTFDAVGGFDERFFAYLEDVDLVARLISGGARCRLATRARARHRHSATSVAGSRRKNELMGWSRGYTLGKYRVHRRPVLLTRALVTEGVVTAGQAVVDRTIGGLPSRVTGFKAGLHVEAHPLPPLPSSPFSVIRGLRTRLRRRLPH